MARRGGAAGAREPATTEALPWLVEDATVKLFEKHKVLSKRELEARYEVASEQYTTTVNIEAETAASIARTLVLPAALRHLALVKEAGVERLVAETQELVESLVAAIGELERANSSHPHVEGLEHAKYMRDTVLPAMGAGSRTSSSGSSPTTSGRSRSTRRCCSSSERVELRGETGYAGGDVVADRADLVDRPPGRVR